jgi:hypothetical protein
MLKAVQHRLRRLGFVSALLLALVMVVPTPQAEARTAVPDSICSLSTITLADDCGDAECRDCLAGCVHNCCHGPHPALAASLSVRLVQADRPAIAAVDEAVGAPGRLPGGPDHPPRD